MLLFAAFNYGDDTYTTRRSLYNARGKPFSGVLCLFDVDVKRTISTVNSRSRRAASYDRPIRTKVI